MPAIADVMLSAEGGLSGVYTTARLDVSFDISFSPPERECGWDLWVHLAEQARSYPVDIGDSMALVADVNLAHSPVRWSPDLDDENSEAATVRPRGREVLATKRACILDFSAVLRGDTGVESLWSPSDLPLWSLEVALRSADAGYAYVSHPFPWNPLRPGVANRSLSPDPTQCSAPFVPAQRGIAAS